MINKEVGIGISRIYNKIYGAGFEAHNDLTLPKTQKLITTLTETRYYKNNFPNSGKIQRFTTKDGFTWFVATNQVEMDNIIEGGTCVPTSILGAWLSTAALADNFGCIPQWLTMLNNGRDLYFFGTETEKEGLKKIKQKWTRNLNPRKNHFGGHDFDHSLGMTIPVQTGMLTKKIK